MQVELHCDVRAELGEGPAWHAREQRLYWVDIVRQQVYAGCELFAHLPATVGCLAPCDQGGLALAFGANFAHLAPGASVPRSLARLDEPQGNRFNDGKCDPAGRFLVGTMDRQERLASGALYSFDGRSISRLLDGLRIPNGLAWSPDYRTFYHIDTPTHQVRAFDYDLQSGRIANPRTAIQVPEALGWPDGMTSDTQGNLWIAMWGGARVTKWDPYTGELSDQIPVPVLQPSSCVFGGADLNELYITSARIGLDAAKLAEYPLSGGVFRIATRATGMPTFEFRLQ